MSVRINDNSRQVQAQIAENIKKALEAVGFYVEGQARKNIHDNGSVDTGFMLNNVSSEVDLQEKSVRIGSEVKYAIYVEKGTGIHAVDGNGRQTVWSYQDPETGKTIWTHGQEAKPFLAPAAENNIDTIRNIIAANMAVGMT